MRACRGMAVFAGCALLSLGFASASHDQDRSAELAYAHPRNLKVLPRDISAAALKNLMERYREALGVSCSYCHAEDERTGRLDYASDEKPAKATARLMITMLNDINGKYLAQLGDPRYAVNASCGSCHQGESDPPVFEPDGAALTQR